MDCTSIIRFLSRFPYKYKTKQNKNFCCSDNLVIIQKVTYLKVKIPTSTKEDFKPSPDVQRFIQIIPHSALQNYQTQQKQSKMPLARQDL